MDLFVYTGIVCELFICDFVYVVLMDSFVDNMVAISLNLLSGMESTSVPSNEHASTTGFDANTTSMRVKCDPAWDHVAGELKERKKKSSYRYIHCGKVYKGRGINRMKDIQMELKAIWHHVKVYLMMLGFKRWKI